MGPRWPGRPGGPEIQGGHMGPRWPGRPGGPEIQGGHQVQRLARPCSPGPGGATWDFAHGRQEAHVAILPAGARGRGGAKPTCATISGGKLPRTPCGRRRPTAREPRGILPPQPRENLTWSTWRIATWKHGPRGDFYTFTVSGGKHVGQGAWTRSECPAHVGLRTTQCLSGRWQHPT